MPSPTLDLQSGTLRSYTVLHQLRPHWGGSLVLNVGLDARGAAISFAANIAGAVCVSLEDNPDLVRAAMRSGSCDFIVNTLDEAVRAMKNEVRKKVPLCVGLEGNPAVILAEILERGIAPELFTGETIYPEAAATFRSLGTQLVSFDALPEHVADPHGEWHLHTFNCATSAELRAFDASALASLPPEDHFRRQWLHSTPKLLPRDRHRVLWLTEAEATALNALSSASLL